MGYRDRIERLLGDSLASLNLLVILSAAYRFAEGRGLETFSTRELMWIYLTGSISLPGSVPELSLGSAGLANRAWEAPDFFPSLRTGARGWQAGTVLVNGCNHFDGSSWPQECQREDAKPTVPWLEVSSIERTKWCWKKHKWTEESPVSGNLLRDCSLDWWGDGKMHTRSMALSTAVKGCGRERAVSSGKLWLNMAEVNWGYEVVGEKAGRVFRHTYMHTILITIPPYTHTHTHPS